MISFYLSHGNCYTLRANGTTTIAHVADNNTYSVTDNAVLDDLANFADAITRHRFSRPPWGNVANVLDAHEQYLKFVALILKAILDNFAWGAFDTPHAKPGRYRGSPPQFWRPSKPPGLEQPVPGGARPPPQGACLTRP